MNKRTPPEVESIVIKSISPILIPQPLLGTLTVKMTWWKKLMYKRKMRKQHEPSRDTD